MNNRIIKFRVWNNKTKSWIHGPYKCDLHGPGCNELDGVNLLGETILFGCFLDGVSIEDLNEIITVQFTGLKDKDGHDIFEGDIVKVKSNTNGTWAGYLTGEVIYHEIDASFKLKDEYGISRPWSIGNEAVIEVVGNIFENPELKYEK